MGNEIFSKRDEYNIEVNLMSYQRLLFELLGVTFKICDIELEMLFNKMAFHRKVPEGLNSFLEYLSHEGIRTGIISNSSLSSKALEQELHDCGIHYNFEFIMSTVEYCIRKPDRRLFDIALIKMGLSPSDVWYIGNSFEHDIIGADNAGIKGVWYNQKNQKPIKDIDYLEFKSYQDLLENMKRLNHNKRGKEGSGNQEGHKY